MRSSIALCLLGFALATPGFTQPTGETSGPLALEKLRDEAQARVEEMGAEFKSSFEEALPILTLIPVDSDSQRAASIRTELTPWASVFHADFIGGIKASAGNHVRGHLALILAKASPPKGAEGLLALFGTEGPELDLLAIRTVGAMSDPGNAAREQLAALATRTELVAETEGAILTAMASTRAPGAAAAARRRIDNPAAPPAVRACALTALSIVGTSPRDDMRLIVKELQQPDVAKPVRIAALRALSRYEEGHENRRALHDALEDIDMAIVAAALDALEVVANKDTSKRPLLKLVKSGADLGLRERAARILVRLGSVQGARHLVEPIRKHADENRRDDGAQREAARAYYRLDAFDDAYTYFERAIAHANPARRYSLRIWLGRCRAQLGQFDRAAKKLREAGYESFRTFADDPAFQVMRKHPKWSRDFEAKKKDK